MPQEELYGLKTMRRRELRGRRFAARRGASRRGVDFIQVVPARPIGETYHHSWDAHSDLESTTGTMARMVDKPIGCLLADLKSRGFSNPRSGCGPRVRGLTSYGRSANGRDHTLGATPVDGRRPASRPATSRMARTDRSSCRSPTRRRAVTRTTCRPPCCAAGLGPLKTTF